MADVVNNERLTARPPRRFDAIVEAVCAHDREYFEAHPAEHFYARGYVPGELWPYLDVPQDAIVLVRLIEPGRPGARMRTPIPGHTLEEVRALLTNPQITVFVPSLDGKYMEALR